jgi:ATP-dependent RNA/DNA helicase IGHMBP2
LLRGKKAVLAGDHCQLPPTIKCSNREVQTELGKTLFERLMKAYEHNKSEKSTMPSKMLEVQYRMHENIGKLKQNMHLVVLA